MHRQQAIGLLLQPLLSLLMLAVRTMPVAARSSDPVLMATVMTAEDDVPQLSRTTASNGTEHLLLLEGDSDRIRCFGGDAGPFLKKPIAVLPQAVCHRRHNSVSSPALSLHRFPADSGEAGERVR